MDNSVMAGHPYGVQPEGNLLTTIDRKAIGQAQAGLGLLALLPHELLLDILSRLDPRSLACVAQTSRSLYAFAHAPDLWKAFVIRACPHGFQFRGSWKETYTHNVLGLAIRHIPLLCPHVYSDALYATASARSAATLAQNLGGGRRNNMTIIQADAVTPEQFRATYEHASRPCLIRGAAPWVHAKEGPWSSLHALTQACGSVRLDAFDEFQGSVQLTLQEYLQYANETHDPRPLYVFEPDFVAKLPALTESWSPPTLFDQDLMAVLGETLRPDYRWLLVGPPGSGTNFHVDPNYTAAWNTVVIGRKLWLLFPPDILPPGVAISEDGCRVLQADNVTAWFEEYYEQLHEDSDLSMHAVETICQPGETVFIPAGWWHLVLNLEVTVAVTQNYVSEANLPASLDFLASGIPAYMNHAGPPDLHTRFRTALQQQQPHILTQCPKRAKTSLWSQWNAPLPNVNNSPEIGSTASHAPQKDCDSTKDTPTPQGTFSFSFAS